MIISMLLKSCAMPPGQLTDRVHLLRLAKLLFDRLAARHLLAQAFHRQLFAPRGAKWSNDVTRNKSAAMTRIALE